MVAAGPVSATPQPAVPTFVNGLAQAVFSTNPADWYSGEVWVQAPFDSDGDHRLDRIHADFTAPREVLTDGLKVPVIFEDSPYYAGTAPEYSNWGVDHELGSPPASRPLAPYWTATNTSPTISTRYESTWVPRGFAVVHAESPGTGYSDGCPTSGGRNETLAAKAVIDWLDGRVPAYTTRTGDTRAVATWTTGKVGMIGTSYNGTIPEAVATTGVPGLEAIVPISAISDWYDYYRANGMVRAPHSSSSPSGDNNAFQGEDLDVLADVVYSRIDEVGQRTICQPEIDYLKAHIDRATGNRNAVWQERNYMKDVENVHAAALLAHGNNDFNVMTKNAAQFYDALKKQGVPHMFYFHQGGHGGAPPDVLVNYWFTRYLYGVHNGVENLPRSWVVREAASCPPRQTTVTGDQSNTATLVVADTSPFRIGFTLTVPQTNADGTTTSTTRLITDIPDSTHLVLASAVATAAGQKVADGAVVSLVCGPANPTPYAEWPDPASRAVALHLTPGARARRPDTRVRGSGRPDGDADRRRVDRRHHVSEHRLLERAADPRDAAAHAAGPHQRHGDDLAGDGVQQVEGEPHCRARELPAERRRHDPHARLERSGQPRLRLYRHPGPAGHLLPDPLRHAAEGYRHPSREPAGGDGPLQRPRLHDPAAGRHAADARPGAQLACNTGGRRLDGARRRRRVRRRDCRYGRRPAEAPARSRARGLSHVGVAARARSRWSPRRSGRSRQASRTRAAGGSSPSPR